MKPCMDYDGPRLIMVQITRNLYTNLRTVIEEACNHQLDNQISITSSENPYMQFKVILQSSSREKYEVIVR